VSSATLGDAWSHAQPTAVELPVYHHWEFSTGPVGDIETLARRLRRPEQYAGDTTLRAQLGHIGEQPVAVDGDRLLFEGKTADRTVFEGAMVSLGFEPTEPNATFSQKLAAILNSGQAAVAEGGPKAPAEPTLSPPIYGEHPAKHHAIKLAGVTSYWLDGLNAQPRYRLAAGWGAEVVRQNQDELMQAAWAQLGDVLAAERAFSLARLAHDVLVRVARRHIDKLPAGRVLALLAPARARVRVGPEQSLYGRIGGATLPDELFDGAMRRLTSARRSTFRMAQWRARDQAPVSVGLQMKALVDTFAKATQNLDAVDPNRFVPDGILGTASFDGVALPDDPDALVELGPHTGLPGAMKAGEIRRIQEQRAAAQIAAAKTKREVPSAGDVWRRGLITETHVLRVIELERAVGRPLEGDIARLIQQVSRSGTEGVLLAVGPQGELRTQGLKIDGRSGGLEAIGSTFTAVPRGRAVRAAGKKARIAAGSVAAVTPHALKLYGNTAVFSTLPAGTLGQGGDPVRIGLGGPGAFTAVPDARPGVPVVPTITMPPAVKDHAVLSRYSQAFKDYQALWEPPPKSEPSVRAVDFDLVASALDVRTRIDPGRTIPARLATTLSLGGQAVSWASTGLVSDFIAARLDLAFPERLRYVIPPRFDRVMAYPHLPFPLSKKLEKLAPEVFLPGVGVLPEDFIMAVQTNPRFVESFMVGANHEMGREMLWQGLPTDQRGTPFQHFWQRLDGGIDIAPIHQWHATPLGGQPGSTPMLVLLIRGQLLERFPTVAIFAYPKAAGETRPGMNNLPSHEMNPELMRVPVFRGHLNKDITYFGFDIAPSDMESFFFVVQEQMTEPRFGFDEPDGEGQDGPTWLDVDWSEVGVAGGEHFGSANLRRAPPAQGKAEWKNPHAATVADALLQRPFRGYWAGARLKTPPSG